MLSYSTFTHQHHCTPRPPLSLNKSKDYPTPLCPLSCSKVCHHYHYCLRLLRARPIIVICPRLFESWTHYHFVQRIILNPIIRVQQGLPYARYLTSIRHRTGRLLTKGKQVKCSRDNPILEASQVSTVDQRTIKKDNYCYTVRDAPTAQKIQGLYYHPICLHMEKFNTHIQPMKAKQSFCQRR